MCPGRRATTATNRRRRSSDVAPSCRRIRAAIPIGGSRACRLARDADENTLAHELTHAHAFLLEGKATWAQQSHTHFYSEGLAMWVAADALGHDPGPPHLAGAIWATDQARFDELVESARHQARHDITQSYVLGQVFVDALIGVAGPEAIPCVSRALGAVGEREVPGLALWYGLAETCRFDLDAVQDRWRAELAASAAALPPLPRMSASVVGDEVRVTVDPPGAALRCGFRGEATDEVIRWRYEAADPGGVCRIPNDVRAGPTFQYQVGVDLQAPEGEPYRTLFLPWTDARTP